VPPRLLVPALSLTGFLAAVVLPLAAQEQPENVIETLQARLDKGEISLRYDEKGHGYLRGVLKALNIPEESQVLPFSKSSFQADLISPDHPRAVYFGDDVAVAAVDGDMLEIIANNKAGGAAFYTLTKPRFDAPAFEKRLGRCVECHALVGHRTIGWIVADITTSSDGMPHSPDPAQPFRFTDHTAPFEHRWGGWYVTGDTGTMRHRGNVTSRPAEPYDLPPTAGLNVTDLSGHFDAGQVLQPGSDVVALLVLEHQTGFTNRAFALNVSYAEQDAQQLARYMTFQDEVALPSPVTGSSAFAERFAMAGPRDPQGRSLREFDLKTRMFRYPLSYMIYSTAFDALAPRNKALLYGKLHDILQATPEGRAAIAIAAATKPDIPEAWKAP
jgi:hypothetical protein